MSRVTQKRRQLDMTNGPLLSKIIMFVLPLMATNLLQVLYNAADMVVVSLSTEPDSVGAIGTTSAFINLVINIFIGFSTGANVVAANYIGSEDDDGVSKTVHTSVLMSLIFGVISGAVGIAVSRSVLASMGNTGKLLDLASLYTVIYFIGVPFISCTNYCISILRAKGDTQTPLVIMASAGILNVVLNLFFVLVCRMSVDGVATATVISNVASAIALLAVLSRENGACKLTLKKLRIDRDALLRIIKIGLPAGIQGAIFSVSNMIIQSSIISVNNAMCPSGSSYQPVVKGNSAAANLEGFSYTATNSVHLAAVSFAGQNTGAGKYDRVRKVMRCCYFVTFCIAVIMGGMTLLLRVPLLSLYGVHPGTSGSLERLAYDTAVCRMLYMLTPYFLLAFMEIGSGILRGMGYSTTSMLVSLMGSCVLRIIWIYTVFSAVGTLGSVYISYPISWALTALTHFVCCMLLLRHISRSQTEYIPKA